MKMIHFLGGYFLATLNHRDLLTAINRRKNIVSKIYNLVTVIMENMEKEENTYQRCILEIFIAGQPWG